MKNMNKWMLSLAVVVLSQSAVFAAAPTFKKLVLSDKFYAEGSYYGDFNRDGHLDVVAGPFWYEGPDFQRKHEIYPPEAYDPKKYSENFFTYVGDFNGDGWPDILRIPTPGKDAYWYENPAGKDQPWKEHLALKDVGNESPVWGDINGDGRPELIHNTTGYVGYATYDPAHPDQMWVFHRISPDSMKDEPSTQSSQTENPRKKKNPKYFRYTHGIGYGDINGDGRMDIVESMGWWEQPAVLKEGEPWIWHPYRFADEGAQMLVYDVDGDGLNDIVTAWHCHHYGLVWYQQIRDAKGNISWKQHEILPIKPDLNSPDLRISQMHAFDAADFNGDGLKDFVTGKRYWAHGPKGDVEPDAPAVLYWFELQRDKNGGAKFIPHQIDDNSGVGTQVTAVDLNGDGTPDILVSNKKGTFVFLNQPEQ